MNLFMNKTLNLIAITAIIISIFLGSCIKDNFDFNKMADGQWNPNFSIAAFNSHMTLYDALQHLNKDTLIITNPIDRFLTLQYQKTVYSQYAEELIIIPDQSNDLPPFSVPPGIDLLIASMDEFPITIPTYVYSLSTPDKSNSLDTILVSSGIFSVELSSINPSFKMVGSLKITIPSATKNGKILQVELPFVNNAVDVDLANYNFKNPFRVDFEVKVKKGTVLTGTSQINIKESFKCIKYEKLYGKFGNYTFDSKTLGNNVDISIFKNPIFDISHGTNKIFSIPV